MNKRGLELAINTIVILVLALAVLSFLVLFFAVGSGGFLSEIKGYFSYSNVDSVVSGCNIAVDSGRGYEYCCEKKDVKYYMNGEKVEGDFSCRELLNKSFISGLNDLECDIKC